MVEENNISPLAVVPDKCFSTMDRYLGFGRDYIERCVGLLASGLRLQK